MGAASREIDTGGKENVNEAAGRPIMNDLRMPG